MVLDAPDQLRQASDLGRDDDARVLSAILLPLSVKSEKVSRVEGEDRAPLSGGVRELILSRDTLVSPSGALATEGVEPSPCERWSQPGVDVLVGEEGNAATGHGALWADRLA